MWKCPQCGESNDEQADVCVQCGFELVGDWGESAEQAATPPNSPSGDRVEPTNGPLTSRQFAEIACQIIALWLLVNGVVGLMYSATWMFKPSDLLESGAAWARYSLFFSPVAYLACGALLWGWSPSLARHIAADNRQVTTSIDANQLLSVALIALGFGLLMTSVQSIAQEVFLLASLGQGPERLWNDDKLRSEFFGGAVTVALSIGLILGSTNIVQRIRPMRDETCTNDIDS